MSDNHINRARDVIERNLPAMPDQVSALTSRDIARALADAGLLVSDEHNREVAARAWDEGCKARAEASLYGHGVINPYEGARHE